MVREKFEEQLEKLDRQMENFGNGISEGMEEIVDLIQDIDDNRARVLVENETEARELKNNIEEKCIHMIMKEQPVATDLRVISSTLKMVTDMARIQRLIGDIAEMLIDTNKRGEKIPEVKGFCTMASTATEMVKKAATGHTNHDMNLIEEVEKMDDIVDSAFEDVKSCIRDMFKNDEGHPEVLINCLMIAKHFERIGDHAESICKWTRFMITGEQKEVQ